MALVIAGIDEAGYGPLLGPLCVGLSVFRVPEGDGGQAPDLWSLLSVGVTREPGRGGSTDAMGRVAIGDSKRLKLANSVSRVDPLVHLERGVLAMLRQLDPGERLPDRDGELFERLGAALPAHACYGGDGVTLPVSMSVGEASLAAAGVARAMDAGGCDLLDLRCLVTSEPEFNRTVRERGGKGRTTIEAFGAHLRHVWSRHGEGARGRLGVVCDRLGGRSDYAGVLEEALPGTTVATLEESPARSRYVVTGEGRRAGVVFLTESEGAHLPVALASMTAKLVRELLMRRFNAYWGARARADGGAALKPTAGYTQDGRRWLRDAAGVLSAGDRRDLVRIA